MHTFPRCFAYVYLQAHFIEAHVTANRVDSWADCRKMQDVNLVNLSLPVALCNFYKIFRSMMQETVSLF